MKSRLPHRLTALLGMLAMLGSLLAGPVASAAALTKAGGSHAVTGVPATIESHAHHHGHKATTAASAIKSDITARKMPCEDPCPSCPKGKHEMAGCMMKCFQSPAAPLGAQSRIATPRGAALTAPAVQVLAKSLTAAPGLRPPIL